MVDFFLNVFFFFFFTFRWMCCYRQAFYLQEGMRLVSRSCICILCSKDIDLVQNQRG